MMSPQAQEIRTFMERTAASSIVQAHLPVETRRAQFEAQRALIPLPSDVQVEAITVGSVATEWVHTPEFDEHQVVLSVHGIEAHGGELRLEPHTGHTGDLAGENQRGTTFSFELPL